MSRIPKVVLVSLLLASCKWFNVNPAQRTTVYRGELPTKLGIMVAEPPFGLREQYKPPKNPNIRTLTDDEVYTHWVDNSGTCSDSGNGTPASPRCTIPTASLAAGSVVQVRGGPYTYSGSTHVTWTATGTADEPVFIRGPSSPASRVVLTFGATAVLSLSATYLIVENFSSTGGVLRILTGNHVALRHYEIHNMATDRNPITSVSASYVVFYDYSVHDYGEWGNGAADDVGISLNANIDHVWVLDSDFHNISGDGIMFCHGCATDGPPNNGPAYVYISGSTFYHDEENAIDLKEFIGPVIISENLMYDFAPSTESNGDAIRINDEGLQGDVWILNNEIHDASYGVNPSNAAGNVYVLGNYIHDCDYGVAWAANGSYVIFGNTFYTTTQAIMAGEAKNNIISQASSCHICEDVTGCSHNLVYQDPGSPVVQVSCTNNVTDQDPLLNVTTGKISVGSPAIDVGTTHSVYATFLATYGLAINEDRDGETRPYNSIWDIGSDEYVP